MPIGWVITMNTYPIETTITISNVFTLETGGAPFDPSSIAAFVTDPTGNQMQYDYPATVQRNGVGDYSCQVTPGQSGRWTYTWQGILGGVTVTSPDVNFLVSGSLNISG